VQRAGRSCCLLQGPEISPHVLPLENTQRPRGSSHQTALFHLFLSPLFLFIPVPLNSHIKWNRGLDDWLATDTDQPTSGYWRSSLSLCSSALFLCLFGLVRWTVGLLCSVLVNAVALRWNRDRSLSSGKYFHHSFLFSCESLCNQICKSLNSWISHTVESNSLRWHWYPTFVLEINSFRILFLIP